MRVIPKTPREQIAFLTIHLPAWAQEPGAIGLSPAEIAGLQELLDAARDLQMRAADARDAARGATASFNDAAGRMRDAAARAVAKIKATAAGDQAVYSAAMIPQPAPGSPVPAPGKPFKPAFTLVGGGCVRLTWKCRNPRGSDGTMYQIERAVGGTREFTHLATVGEKSFTDTTLPRGAAEVEYRVTAIRSTRRGEAAGFVLTFGVDEAQSAAPRLAA
ncbi:hypothetical protein PHYC_01264 [Phycisphaerales bacterium]|nr:hypothetical protein PHYC_01264 [Phycisphaerales bacterium]